MPKNLANGSFRFFFLITWLLAMPLTVDASCEKARFLSPGDKIEIVPGDSHEWLEVQAFERGLLHIEVSTSHFEKQPMVGFWGFDCAAQAPVDRASIIDRSPEHVTLQVEAFQTAYVRIAATEESVHVRTALVPLGPATGPPTKGGEDEEIIELDGLRAPPLGLCARTDDQATSLVFAPKGGEDEEIIELDGQPVTLGGLSTGTDGQLVFAPQGGEDEEIIELDGLRSPPQLSDDHAASLACATPVGSRRKLAGRFEEAGDVDTFRIRVGSTQGSQEHDLWRLRLDAGVGSSDDLRMALYDAQGLSLGDDPRRGTALAAGVYFLRVGSHDAGAGSASGEYVLALDVEPW